MLARSITAWLIAVWLAAAASSAFAQTDWTVPRAQPFVDLPWQARYNSCPDPGPFWSCDPANAVRGPNGQIVDDCQLCEHGQKYLGPDGTCRECGASAGVYPACGYLARRNCSWYASADFIPLFYDNYSLTNFAANGNNVVLNDADFQTDFNAGGRFVIGRALTRCLYLEGGYQGFYDYNDSTLVRDNSPNPLGGTGILRSPFSFGAAPIVGVDDNNLIQVGLRDRFNTAQVNFRYRSDNPPGIWDTFFIVGARFAQVDEQFTYHSRANVPGPGGAVNNVTVNTANEMWGAQLGFGLNALLTRKGWAEFQAKGALLNNGARQNTVYTNIDENGVTTNFPGAANRERTAFLGEISLVGNYQLTRYLIFRAGYQATWIQGIALGADNFQTNLNVLRAGPATIDHNGTAVWHGPVLGLELMR